MKVLFVCVDNYPYDGACTNLLKKLFFDGNLAGDKTEIHIATYQHSFYDKKNETIDGVIIHRYLNARYLSMSEILKKKKDINLLISGLIVRLKKRISLKLNNCVGLDKGQINEYSKYLLKLCKGENYDVIVGVAGCYEIVIAAQMVASRLSIPFILYQVDPFTDNIMLSEKDVHERLEIEKHLYKNSIKVFTTEIILNKMRERMSNKDLENIEVMEFPGVSINPSAQNNKFSIKRGTLINCVFAGRIYKGIRNPKFTINLFREFPSYIQLKLYGVTEKDLMSVCPGISIPNNIQCCGLVSVEEADDVINKADILVNIGNIMINQVPSKLFSYISTGKPILNICVNHNCPTKKYLRNYPYSLSIDEKPFCDDTTIKEVLTFLNNNAGKAGDLYKIQVQYEKCTPTYAARQMKRAFIKSCTE